MDLPAGQRNVVAHFWRLDSESESFHNTENPISVLTYLFLSETSK